MTSLATSFQSLPKRQAGGPNGAVTLVYGVTIAGRHILADLEVMVRLLTSEISPFWKGLRIIQSSIGRLFARHSDHLLRWDAAMRSRPSGVFGPVESPPWDRQRRFPGTTFALHRAPFTSFAPQLGSWSLASV